MTRFTTALAAIGAALLAFAFALMPVAANAEPGVPNSEVTFSADNTNFAPVDPDDLVPQKVDGGPVVPGGPPQTHTTHIRHETANEQKLDVLVAVPNLSTLTADRRNPSDFVITVSVDGQKGGEYRLGDLFTNEPPYGGADQVRRVGPQLTLDGAKGQVNTVVLELRVPAGSGNASQGARALYNLAVIPQAPSPTPTPTDTAEPTPTESGTPTAEPTPTDTAEPTPTESGTPTAEPTPTDTAEPTPTESGTATAEPTPTDTAEPTPTESATPTAEPTPTDTAEPTPTESATPTAEPTPTESATPTDTAEPTPTPTSTGTAEPTPSASQTDAPAPPHDDGDQWPPRRDHPTGPLPRTGSDVALGLGLGLALVGIGTVAAITGRRRRA